MFKIPCFCGKNKKMFKHNIGPKYSGECCEEAGWGSDGQEPKVQAISDPKEIEKVKADVHEMEPEPEMDDLVKRIEPSKKKKKNKHQGSKFDDFLKEDKKGK